MVGTLHAAPPRAQSAAPGVGRPPSRTPDPIRRLAYDGHVLDERDLEIIAALQGELDSAAA